ncbi:hypothetical protein ACFC6L_18630 [Kitasatospora phosalacinea]|uniref:hypothetical protein n=1 Tax=Kitasatospora phosalacinea TaxID=2065 RepID=UPI0035DA7184
MAAPLTTTARPAALPAAEPPQWPEVYSYLHHAFLCDVLRPHPAFDDWLAGTFLRLYAHRDFAAAAVPFNFDVGDRIVRNPDDGRHTHAVLDYYRRVPLLALAEHDRRPVAELPAAAAFLADSTAGGGAVLVYAEKSHVPGTEEYGRARAVHQVMYTRGPAPGTLRAHAMGAGGRYVRADTTPAEAALACVEARVTAAHRRRVLVLHPRPDDGAHRFTPATLHLALTRAVDGRLASEVEDPGSAGAPVLTAGLAASRTLVDQAARMLHGELPLDIRPFHVYLEHKQRLAAALGLLAARAAGGGDRAGRAGAAFAPSPESLERAARLRDQAAALRFAMLRCTRLGTTPQAATAWLRQAEPVLEEERLLHHALCRETAPNRRVTLPAGRSTTHRPDQPPRTGDQ